MRLVLKFAFLSFLLAFSLKSFAGNYVSIFKPEKQIKTLSEFKEDIQKDVSKLRSIINTKDSRKNLEQKKTVELVKLEKIEI